MVYNTAQATEAACVEACACGAVLAMATVTAASRVYLQVTSIESVQRALYESGNVSLGEALANNLAERLHLPRRHATAAEAAEAALAPSAPPPEEHCTETFELVLQAQLPPWFTPYPFVLTSYRSGFSYRLCLASLFRLHNETLNVWSELAPAVCFAVWMARHIYIHICSLDPNPTRTLDQRPSPLTLTLLTFLTLTLPLILALTLTRRASSSSTATPTPRTCAS